MVIIIEKCADGKFCMKSDDEIYRRKDRKSKKKKKSSSEAQIRGVTLLFKSN